MGRYLLAAVALVASPVFASDGVSTRAAAPQPPVDWLYPEMPIADGSWRELEAVILIDARPVADASDVERDTPNPR